MNKTSTRFASYLTLGASLATLLAAPDAQAGYSIVAADTESGLVGAAGTSCVSRQFGWSLHEEGYGSAPGRGAFMAQGMLPLAPVYGQLSSAILGGVAPLAHADAGMKYVRALAAPNSLLAMAYDNGQFGAVTLDPGSQNDWLLQFSNAATDPVFGGSVYRLAGTLDVSKKQSLIHGFRYAIQANLVAATTLKKNMTAAEMVTLDAESAFTKKKTSAATNLLDRLAWALSAGAAPKKSGEDRQGDKRCIARSDGSPAIAGDSAFIQVEDAEGPIAQIIVDESCQDASNCQSAAQVAKIFYGRCRSAFRGYLKSGASYTHFQRYVDRCFVRADNDGIVTGPVYASKPNQPLTP